MLVCVAACTPAPFAVPSLMTEHYIIPVKNEQAAQVWYDYQQGHPVLVVSVKYFEKQEGKARSMQPLTLLCLSRSIWDGCSIILLCLHFNSQNLY